MAPAPKRLQKEREGLPPWAELLHEAGDSWSLRLTLHPDRLALDVTYRFPEGYPFKPPVIHVTAPEGSDISLPCMRGNWSPALTAYDVLEELLATSEAAAKARDLAAAEIARLRTDGRPWLVDISDPLLQPWVNDDDACVFENVHLDPVCPPGCARTLRRRSMMTHKELELVGPARRSVPPLGPWRIVAIVRPPEDSMYFVHDALRGLRVELLFGMGFPKQPLRLRVLSIIQHLHGAFEMPLAFYKRLQALCAGESPEFTMGVEATLQTFMQYLSGPLPELLEDGLLYVPELRGEEAVLKWQEVAQGNLERLRRIARYGPERLHPELFSVGPRPQGIAAWAAAGLSPPVVKALENGCVRDVALEVAPGVFAMDLFSDALCNRLLDEFDNYERVAKAAGWPIARPNSMNNYGLILGDVGLEAWVDALQADVIGPISAELFPLEGAELTKHHAFLVAYEPGADLGLDMHTDDSDVTLNVCLGREFTGAGLTFCGRQGAPDHRQQQCVYRHRKGAGVLHLGRHRHGADDIVSGQRRNLIVWSTNPCYRATANYIHPRAPLYRGYARESGPPDVMCVSRTFDLDASRLVAAPGGVTSPFAWVPPPGASFEDS